METVYQQMISPMNLPDPQVMCVAATSLGTRWWGKVGREHSATQLRGHRLEPAIGRKLRPEFWERQWFTKRHVDPNGSVHPYTRGPLIWIKG